MGSDNSIAEASPTAFSDESSARTSPQISVNNSSGGATAFPVTSFPSASIVKCIYSQMYVRSLIHSIKRAILIKSNFIPRHKQKPEPFRGYCRHLYHADEVRHLAIKVTLTVTRLSSSILKWRIFSCLDPLLHTSWLIVKCSQITKAVGYIYSDGIVVIWYPNRWLFLLSRCRSASEAVLYSTV